jgi:hypothetical protein
MSGATAANVAFMRRQEIALATDAPVARSPLHAKSLACVSCMGSERRSASNLFSQVIDFLALASAGRGHLLELSNLRNPTVKAGGVRRSNVCFRGMATFG